MTITNSTLSNNYATDSGGGIHGGGSIKNSTISNNTANEQGGGISVGGNLQIGNTILKAGTSGANISTGGTVTSHGYNLSSDDGGGFLTATGDQINTDPCSAHFKTTADRPLRMNRWPAARPLTQATRTSSRRLPTISVASFMIASLTRASTSGHWRCNQRRYRRNRAWRISMQWPHRHCPMAGWRRIRFQAMAFCGSPRPPCLIRRPMPPSSTTRPGPATRFSTARPSSLAPPQNRYHLPPKFRHAIWPGWRRVGGVRAKHQWRHLHRRDRSSGWRQF